MAKGGNATLGGKRGGINSIPGRRKILISWRPTRRRRCGNGMASAVSIFGNPCVVALRHPRKKGEKENPGWNGRSLDRLFPSFFRVGQMLQSQKGCISLFLLNPFSSPPFLVWAKATTMYLVLGRQRKKVKARWHFVIRSSNKFARSYLNEVAREARKGKGFWGCTEAEYGRDAAGAGQSNHELGQGFCTPRKHSKLQKTCSNHLLRIFRTTLTPLRPSPPWGRPCSARGPLASRPTRPRPRPSSSSGGRPRRRSGRS